MLVMHFPFVAWLKMCFLSNSSGLNLDYLSFELHDNFISGLVVSVVDPQPGDDIIDCCAAPGGKTLYMASHLSGKGIPANYCIFLLTGITTSILLKLKIPFHA